MYECMILYYIVLHIYTILYYTIHYILYYTLYYILYYTILYYTILYTIYYTILYYTILYYRCQNIKFEVQRFWARNLDCASDTVGFTDKTVLLMPNLMDKDLKVRYYCARCNRIQSLYTPYTLPIHPLYTPCTPPIHSLYTP